MDLIQPKCHCLQCEYWSLVFYSVIDAHKCLECEVEIKNKFIDHVIAAFALKKSDPLLIKTFNKVYCISCQTTGSVFFDNDYREFVNCAFCEYKIPMENVIDAKANVYKTILLEKSYNYTFTWVK